MRAASGVGVTLLFGAFLLVASLVTAGMAGAGSSAPWIEDEFATDSLASSAWHAYRSHTDGNAGVWDAAEQAVYLTRGISDHGAAIFSTRPLTAKVWEASFRIKMGGTGDGDGMTFFFYKDEAPYAANGMTGASGASAGFKGAGYAIRFDTSSGESCPGAANALGILEGTPCSSALRVSHDIVNLRDGAWHDVTVTYSLGHVRVLRDGHLMLDRVLTSMNDANTGVGFSASTGLSTDTHAVDDFVLTEMRGPIAVDVTTNHDVTCFDLADGASTCYGNNPSAHQLTGEIAKLGGGNGYICGVRTNGTVDCSPEDYFHPPRDYASHDAVDASASNNVVCVLRLAGTVLCQGRNSFEDPVANYTGGDAVAISVGPAHVCVLLTSGNVTCYGTWEVPSYTGSNAVAVSSGESFACALTTASNVACWGYNSDGRSGGYSGGDAIAVSNGHRHACALLSTGNIRCWGQNGAGQSASYLGGDAEQVAAGMFHTCARLANGNIHCWGENISAATDWTNDALRPIVTVPAGIVREATGPLGATVTWSATAVDSGGQPLPVSCSPASGARFALGVATVTCTASDANGTAGSAQFQITVQDTTPPAISAPDVSAQGDDTSGTTVTYPTPDWTDVVDGRGPASCNPARGSKFPAGTSIVTCSHTDARGNTGFGTFAVRIVPTLPVEPRNVSVSAGPGGHNLTIHWASPARDGAGYITEYRIYTPESRSYRLVATLPDDHREYLVTGLYSSQTYTYYVAAVNVAGQGPWGWGANKTIDPPSQPNYLTAKNGVVPGDVVLTWKPPERTGGLPVVVYRVYNWMPGRWEDEQDMMGETTNLTFTVKGCPVGVECDYFVRAVTDAGEGMSSNIDGVQGTGMGANPEPAKQDHENDTSTVYNDANSNGNVDPGEPSVLLPAPVAKPLHPVKIPKVPRNVAIPPAVPEVPPAPSSTPEPPIGLPVGLLLG